jgi:hypothetical protein
LAVVFAAGQAWADELQSIADGSWSDANTWKNVTTGDDPALSPPQAGDNVTNTLHTIKVSTTTPTIGDLITRSQIIVETGGTLNVGDDYRISSSASIIIHGTFNVADQKDVRDRVGGYEIDVDGGTYNADQGLIPVRNGDIMVRGSTSTVIAQNMIYGKDTNDGGSLNWEADSSGFTTVQVAPYDGNGGVLSFIETSQRSLSADVSALTPTLQTWTLLTFDSISRDANGDDWQTKTVTGAANPANWVFNVDDDAGEVTLSYVPEPVTLLALGSGLAALLGVRKRRHLV